MGGQALDKRSEEILFCIFRKTSEYHHFKLHQPSQHTHLRLWGDQELGDDAI